MAVLQHFIIPAVATAGVGQKVNTSLVNAYEAIDEQAYLPNGDARYIIKFHMTHAKMNIDWVYADASDRNTDLALVDTAIATLLA
jgi:hypothetical protein